MATFSRGNPQAKHQLLTPKLSMDGSSLIDSFGLSSTEQLFQQLADDVPPTLKALGDVYSFDDAPQPPLARQLLVIGVANASLPFVKDILDDQVPTYFHTCAIAVKRADGDHRSRLAEKDVNNSKAFAYFVRKLFQEQAVAIVACDKYKRFGVLLPSFGSLHPGESSYGEGDFIATSYVADVNQVQEYLSQHPNKAVATAADGLWQPPSSGDTAEGLWKPLVQDSSAEQSALWQPPATSDTSLWQPENGESLAGHKRPRDDDKDKQEAGVSHKDKGARTAQDFYNSLGRNLETRSESRLYHMRAFNGWVKATQIQELDPKSQLGPLRILDLACGKGGDLTKWILHPRGIANYVGSDVADKSLEQAAERARNMRNKLRKCTFTCADLGSDVLGRLRSSKHKYMQKLPTWSLQNEPAHAFGTPEFKEVRGGGVTQEHKFDIVSIQFAIHYMMSTKQRARRFFRTASQLLEVGGDLIVTTTDARVIVNHLLGLGLDLHFDENENDRSSEEEAEAFLINVGGGACQIRFQRDIVERIMSYSKLNQNQLSDDLFGLEYSFRLVEGSEHERGVGSAVDLPEWLTPIPVLELLANEVGMELVYADNFHEYYNKRSDGEAFADAHSSLYNMHVLNQKGSISANEWEISRLYCALKFRKVRDVDFSVDLDDDERTDDEDQMDIDDIDPATKAKLYPVAMMKAKKPVSPRVWAGLSADEKASLINKEIIKLAA